MPFSRRLNLSDRHNSEFGDLAPAKRAVHITFEDTVSANGAEELAVAWVAFVKLTIRDIFAADEACIPIACRLSHCEITGIGDLNRLVVILLWDGKVELQYLGQTKGEIRACHGGCDNHVSRKN